MCAYQEDNGLIADGIVGKNTYSLLMSNMEDDAEDNNCDANGNTSNKHVQISGGQAYVRTVPNIDTGLKLGIAHEGDTLAATGNTSNNGWLEVHYGSGTGWISGKYAKVVA